MSSVRVLAVCGLIALSGCVTQQQTPSDPNDQPGPSITEAFNKSLRSLNDALAPKSRTTTSAAPSVDGARRLAALGLGALLNTSTSSDWPRVALNINRLPPWFYQMPPSGNLGVFGPRDCINVTLTVWRGMTSSKTYDDIDFCGPDIVRNTPFKDVGLMWKNFGIVSGKNTGAQRSTGPLPPQRLWPNKPGLDMFFWMNGSYYLGSIMATLGYNWKEPQDFRFWVVNVPTQAETR